MLRVLNQFNLQSLQISSITFSQKMNFLCEPTNNKLHSGVVAKWKKRWQKKKWGEKLCFVWTGALSWLLMFSDVFFFLFCSSLLLVFSHHKHTQFPIHLTKLCHLIINSTNKNDYTWRPCCVCCMENMQRKKKKWNEFYGGRKYWTTRHTMPLTVRFDGHSDCANSILHTYAWGRSFRMPF